jgi:hypothetical protein
MYFFHSSSIFFPHLPFPTGFRVIPGHCSRPFADDFQRLALRGALQQQRRRRGAAAVGVPILGAVLVDEVPGGWIWRFLKMQDPQVPIGLQYLESNDLDGLEVALL